MTTEIVRRESVQVLAASALISESEPVVRRATSSTPLVGYVAPPAYECSFAWIVARRVLIEVARCALWTVAVALAPVWVPAAYALERRERGRDQRPGQAAGLATGQAGRAVLPASTRGSNA